MPGRVAIDANVLIAGICWPRWPYEVLRHAIRGDYQLVLSPLVITEARRHIAADFPHLLRHFEAFLTTVGHESAPIPTKAEVAVNRRLVRQQADVAVALSVRAARVHYFVTMDRDFTDRGESTLRVQAAIPGIILPAVFLRQVMGWSSQELEAIRRRTWAELSEPAAEPQ